MTYLYLAQKFWRECIIAVLAFLLLICLFLLNSKTGKLEQAEAKCTAQIQKIELAQQTALNQANEKANQVSADYEQLKAIRQAKTETIRDTVQKIITRDVYHNVCFDSDGMQQLGKAINLGKTNDTSEPNSSVSEPDNSE
jgi:hypothetical protein